MSFDNFQQNICIICSFISMNHLEITMPILLLSFLVCTVFILDLFYRQQSSYDRRCVVVCCQSYTNSVCLSQRPIVPKVSQHSRVHRTSRIQHSNWWHSVRWKCYHSLNVCKWSIFTHNQRVTFVLTLYDLHCFMHEVTQKCSDCCNNSNICEWTF
jgi:hypothetical protein